MASDLENKIIRQIEYYFGDINLPKDKFMQEKIKEDEGWITLETLLTFNRLHNLCSDPEVIANAIDKSKLVNVSEDRKKLRRNPDVPLPEFNDERRKEISARTAYAKGFPKEEVLDEIINFLDPYGPIESCQKRTNLDKVSKTHYFKGSCFIIFKDVETCRKFIETESIKYKDTELLRKWKNDYLDEKKKQYQEKKDSRKGKNGTKNETPVVEQKKSFPKGSILYFDGIKEDTMITREEIKEQIKQIANMETSFIDFCKGDTEGYIRFSKENSAPEFFEKLTEGELKVGECALKFKVLEGEKEEEYSKKISESAKEKFAKNKNKGKGKKRKGKFAGFGQKKVKT